MRNGFVRFDDQGYVYENAHVRAGLTREGVAWAFRSEPGTYFHPLTWLSLMLDVELFGVDPVAIHVENVVLHAATAVLLFLAFALATGRAGPALLAALLFALHPLAVEGVAWATERKTALSSALGAAAILCYVLHARRPSRWRLAGVAALLAASLLAKPGLVVLPELLLVMDVWPLGRVPLGQAGGAARARRAIEEKLPLLALSVGTLLLVLPSARLHLAAPVPLAARMANAVAALPHYLLALVAPTGLAVFHPYPRAVAPWAVAAGALAFVAITGVVVTVARRRPWWAFGWAWFLVAVSPYLGLMLSGRWPLWAERFAYVPLFGPCLAASFEVAALPARSVRARAAVTAVVAAALVALGVLTRAQVGVWRDSVSLFQHAVAAEPASTLLRQNLAIALDEAGRLDEALEQLRASVRLDPEEFDGRYSLGSALAHHGDLAEGREHLRAAVRLAPASAEARVQLGVVEQILGRPREAEEQLRAALALDGDNPEALYDLAGLLRATDRYLEAMELYRRFLAVAPERYAPQRAAVEALLSR